MNNDILKLPYSDKGLDIKFFYQLSDFLDIEIDENHMDEQEKYHNILNKIIDSIIEIRYIKTKRGFQFSDIVKLNDYISSQFEQIKRIEEFDCEILADITHSDKDYIYENIVYFYSFYLEKGYIDLSVTSDFCNRLLNDHRNYFFNEQRNDMLKTLASKMELTEKKKNSILNGIRLKRTGKFISCKQFEKLGITEIDYLDSLEKMKKSILNNKDIRKSGIVLNEEYLTYLFDYFTNNGVIDYDIVKQTLAIDDKEIIEYIVNKFGRMLIKFATNIPVRNMELRIYDVKKNKLNGLNYNDYLIASNDVVRANVDKILQRISEDNVIKVLTNKDTLSEILYLMPFVDFFPELDIDKFISILANYDIVREKIGITGSKISIDMSLSKLSDLITLSFAYDSIDDISLIALGLNDVSSLMSNIHAYINCYRKMLDRYYSNVPPVFLQDSEYNYESGLYSDPERLLIGKKPKKHSCIDLFSDRPSGTYREVLLEQTGDVILIRKNNELVSRMFAFRRGNVIQLATQGGENIDIDIYGKIANQIIDASISNNDNIDYVFVNKDSVTNVELEPVYDRRFFDEFPHADLGVEAILLSSKAEVQGIVEEKLNLDFNVPAKGIYYKIRKPIVNDATSFDITRLKALSVFLENDEIKKQNMVKNFQPFYEKDYQKAVCGEDWYIALKNNGEIEELILPLNDTRSYDEFLRCKNEVFNDYNKIV